jgi:hypothetical protein
MMLLRSPLKNTISAQSGSSLQGATLSACSCSPFLLNRRPESMLLKQFCSSMLARLLDTQKLQTGPEAEAILLHDERAQDASGYRRPQPTPVPRLTKYRRPLSTNGKVYTARNSFSQCFSQYARCVSMTDWWRRQAKRLMDGSQIRQRPVRRLLCKEGSHGRK